VPSGAGLGVVFFTAVFVAGADLLAALAEGALTADLRADPVFFVVADFTFAALAALAFLRLATSFALAAAESSCFGFAGSSAAGAGAWASPLAAAHLLRCASAMARRPAALNVRGLRTVRARPGLLVCERLPESMARSSAIRSSIFLFCDSKPSMAAAMISGVSVGISKSDSLQDILTH
jgi:hypothetical protein